MAARTLEYNKNLSKVVITSASGHAKCSSELLFETNNYEEAKTLLIRHAVLASRRNPPDADLLVFSPNTYVLLLVIANYDVLPRNTSRKSKGFAGLTCIFGAGSTGRFHLPQNRWRSQYGGQASVAPQQFLDPLKHDFYKAIIEMVR